MPIFLNKELLRTKEPNGNQVVMKIRIRKNDIEESIKELMIKIKSIII